MRRLDKIEKKLDDLTEKDYDKMASILDGVYESVEDEWFNFMRNKGLVYKDGDHIMLTDYGVSVLFRHWTF